ncbi:MAG: DNA repair protein RecN [Candidatus Baltobacteraceae bacterium]
MLRRLTIENYCLIDRAQIVFARGATMFTGETGSGKTMVLGAIGFALGERATADAAGRNAGRALVTLEFDPSPALRERLIADGYECDPDEYASILREIAPGGKSSLRINGRVSSAGYLREIAAGIADMVGQHEAQRLLSPAYHVQLLDRFSGDDALAAGEEVAALYNLRRTLSAELEALDSGEQRVQEQIAYARFAVGEIRAAALEEGEDGRLVQRRRVLDNAEKIALALRAAHGALAGEENAAADALGSALACLDQISGIAPQFASMRTQVQALQSEVNDVSATIVRESENLEFNPAESEAINARLETIDDLKRKHGGSIQSVLAAARDLESTLDTFENKDEHRRRLQQELANVTARLTASAKRLSELRRQAAKRLSRSVEAELQDLALASSRFEVVFRLLPDIGPGGSDAIEFTFAANKGESLQKIGKAASGGELSRVLLALMVALAGARETTALVFDEIDAGIGGATATAVGARLARLAKSAQVVCVTHLAQIASCAHTHYHLDKREDKNGTTIGVNEIRTDKARTSEIARMLSGESHDIALEHARTLLRQSAR